MFALLAYYFRSLFMLLCFSLLGCCECVSSKRVHFNHCRKIGAAIQGMGLSGAILFLENVLEKKNAVPFLVFAGGIGLHVQVMSFLSTQKDLSLNLLS